MFDLVIKNAIIVTMEENCEPFLGWMAVNGSVIAQIDVGEAPEALEVIDADGDIVFPGMINGHCHGDMTIFKALGDGSTLEEQNNTLVKNSWFKEDLTDNDRILSRQLTYIEAISSGTTFIMENMFWGLGLDSVKAMAETGIKGALAEDARINFIDPLNLISDEFFEEFIRLCKENDIVPVLASVAEEDFDEVLMKKIFAMAKKHNVLVTQHLAETPWRMKIAKEKFGLSPVQYMDSIGLLDEVKVLGSHSVYTDTKDREIMHSKGICAINTPLCEMKIGDGIAPITEYLNEGVNVSLGTDGALWNNSNDMFREVKGTVLLQSVTKGVRSVSARQALEMATINGARSFDLENEIGSLKVGKKADFIIVDTQNPALRPLTLGKHGNVLSNLAFCAVGRDVKDTYINGKAVMKDRKILTMDVKKLVDTMENSRNKILEKYSEIVFYNNKGNL